MGAVSAHLSNRGSQLDLQRYLHAIIKRWRIVAAFTLLGLAAAGTLNLLTPKTYSSSVHFFVSTADASNSVQLAQGGAFTQDRIKSYLELMSTPKVLQPVIDDLGLTETSDSLKSMISSKAAPGTVMIETSVVSTNPQTAMDIATSLGNNFPRTIEELESISSSQPSPIKVTLVQDATTPTTVGPRWASNLVFGLFSGAILGLALALIRDRLDTKLRTKEDVLQVDDDVALLGLIPFDKETPDHPLILEFDPHSRRAEAFRTLRTNLQFADADDQPRVITITSSIPGEGKTTTTANLALAIAESGASVCLIEGDLRRPRLLSYMGLEGGVGLTDVLIGRVAVKDVVQRFGEKRLMVLGAGAIPPNPSELLGTEAMKRLIDDLHTRFDYVIIDAPPLLPVTDAAVLAKTCDGMLVVVGSGIVKRDEYIEGLDALDAVNANILGVILNRIEQGSTGNYYDYRYQDEESENSRSDSFVKSRERS